jgi:hypothetical protein
VRLSEERGSGFGRDGGLRVSRLGCMTSSGEVFESEGHAGKASARPSETPHLAEAVPGFGGAPSPASTS